ncbi:MAG: DVUA0089 family protein, partial [Planctomycetaceae bacterium]|nr:DVUA0089 family protein [Planctomycetaceae bacterium]
MLISAWLNSLRRHVRSTVSNAPVKRKSASRRPSASTEDLEVRSLLTTLTAVRPNVGEFLVNGETRTVAPQELTLQFALSHDVDVASISDQSITVERSGHDGTFGDGNEVPVSIGYVGLGNEGNEIVLRFAENLPDDHYRIVIHGTGSDVLTFHTRGTAGPGGIPFNNGTDGTFRFNLDLGAQIVAVDPMPVTRVAGNLQQARDQIVLYFNDDKLDPLSAEDTAFYQLIFTNDTVTNADDVEFAPATAVYSSTENTVTLTFSTDLDLLGGAGTYRLRVGTDESIPMAPISSVPFVDQGSSFATANTTILGTISTPGNTSHLVTAAISAQFYAFQFPGNQDEPGHREIEVETHVNGGADTASGVSKISYNFRDIYGTDPQGNILHNQITENEKQRAREIFEFYSNLLGIDFIETPSSGLTIVTGDLRALDPTIPTGPGGVAGLAGGGMAIMDNAETWNDELGGSWFNVAMHEIGHLLGQGHTYDQPVLTIQGSEGSLAAGRNVSVEPDFPGDVDIVHGQFLHRPDSIDIDLYQFDVQEAGLFTAEIMAERLSSSSQLDSVLRLFRQNPDGSHELIAQNDDYFSEDSFLTLNLEPGTYFIGVSSTGNDAYDPTIANTGMNGTSEGTYQLRTNFRPNVNAALKDATGQALDGDSNGEAGGVYNFWFRATSQSNTLIVDKAAAPGGNGSLATPFKNIKDATAVAQPGQIIRIVGNGGADGDISTVDDNLPYEIGFNTSNQILADGSTLEVPHGVTVMIDGGAVLKLRRALIGVGSSTATVDRSAAALQVLGTPGNSVIFTSWSDESIGTDTTTTPTTPQSGDWGGLVFRNVVDREQNRFNYQTAGIFLNYVSNATLLYGGGNVVGDSVLQTINPIHIQGAQPTIVNNTIMFSQDSAMSADPDAFEEITFHSPKYQEGLASSFTSDYTRVGPDIYGNTLIHNSINGLFIRVVTPAGGSTLKMTVPGRFDDTDIVHVIGQNLQIQGTPGGPLRDQTAPDVAIVTVATTGTGTIPAGSYNYRIVFVDRNGFESPASTTTATRTLATSGGMQLTQLPVATGNYVGRRIYRSTASGAGPYTLVAELDKSTTNFTDSGTTLNRTLTAVTFRDQARTDARLAIDPGVVVKLEGARIEAEVGAQIIAEGIEGRQVIFTSKLDDRYGAGGTFDTNDDGGATAPSPGNWGGLYIGHMGSVSLDYALITFAGGIVPLEGNFAGFNAVEIHQAKARIRNTIFESNASGQ